jgi:prepilin signal peptidase PulO-like enzyme (type II secretory pathway)
MTPTLLAVGFGAVGLILGIAADRLATRWPEHDEEHPAGRQIGWRTAVCAAFGALAFAVLPMRFGGDQLALALFGAWFVTLIVGMATDLDQRLLPNVLTLPVIPIALIYAASGRNPLVGGDLLPAILVATAVPLVLFLLSIPFGAGAFGIGDVKLLVGVGLMTGAIKAFTGLVSGLLLSGVVLAVLLVTRRVTMKTYIPYGPFLIFGAVWGIIVGR